MVDLIDGPETVAQLLRDGSRWDTNIIEKPNLIKAIYDWPKLQPPCIVTYEISNIPTKRSYGIGAREDRDTRVTIDMRGTNYENVKLYEKAVRKIIRQQRTNIANISLTTELGRTYENPYNQIWEDSNGSKNQSDRRNEFFRITMDVFLQEFGVVLPDP